MPDSACAYQIDAPPLTDAQRIILVVEAISGGQYEVESLLKRAEGYIEAGNFPAVALVVGQIGELVQSYSLRRNEALRTIHELLGEEGES